MHPPHPPIPKPGSYSKAGGACLTTALSLCLSLPGIFSQFKLISRCIALQKNPLSLFLSRSLSSCVRCIHPSLTHYDSVSVSLLWPLPFPLSDRDTKKHLRTLFKLMSTFGYLPILPSLPLLFVWLCLLCFHRIWCNCICFCQKCFSAFICAGHAQTHVCTHTHTDIHGCITWVGVGRKVEVPPQSYFLPTWILRPRSFKRSTTSPTLPRGLCNDSLPHQHDICAQQL